MGWGYRAQMRRLVVLLLDGKTALPPRSPAKRTQPIAALSFKVDEALPTKGSYLTAPCTMRHGTGVSGGVAPDLRASPIVLSFNAIAQTGRHGRPALRMPPFKSMSDDDLRALQHFIRAQAAAGLKGVPVGD